MVTRDAVAEAFAGDWQANDVGSFGRQAATCRRSRSCAKPAGAKRLVARVGEGGVTRRRTNAAAVDRQHAVLWLIAAVVVYSAVALSGVWIASLGQDVRGLFVALEQNQQTQDALLAQYSRLLIERSTLSSYQNVDQVAEQQLTMRFPEIVERVTP